MPQMAPMWWTLIMMTTMSMMLITIMINYFTWLKIKTKSLKTPMKPFYWKW